jgi:hypothetical protein
MAPEIETLPSKHSAVANPPRAWAAMSFSKPSPRAAGGLDRQIRWTDRRRAFLSDIKKILLVAYGYSELRWKLFQKQADQAADSDALGSTLPSLP